MPDVDVFLAGTVFLDMIFTGLPELPAAGAEVFAQGLGSAPGGVANLAVAMSRLGLRVALAAPFGDDMFGGYLWHTLAEQERVDLSRSRRLPGWPTPVTVSLTHAGDRRMVTYRKPVPLPDDALVQDAPPARGCVVGLHREIPSWVARLRERGTLIVGDVRWDPTGTWSPQVLDRLVHVDVFLLNAAEAMAYTRTASPQVALERLAGRAPAVVVTCGADGAYAAEGTARAHARALPVDVLDPTGAGDVFTAGFVYATLAGWPLVERLRFANLCAGLSVRHYSGSLGAPCWSDIAAFGESEDVPADVLAAYGFLVPHIRDDADFPAVRALPTLGYGARTRPGD